MQDLRLGTIGSGVIVHSILDNVQLTDGIRLEAVYSRTREKGEALAASYGVSKVYTDMDAFLADPDIDIVYIATPNLLHYPQAKRALLAGKHVILEKPFTTKAEHAKELIALAREKGLYLVEAAPTSFLPNFEVLKDAVSKIGDIKLILANYSQYSSRFDNLMAGQLPNIFNPAYAGGCLMDINFYNVYLTVSLFGKPCRAVYRPNLYQGKYDTSGVLTMEYDGFTAACTGAKDTWGVNFYQVEGTKGYLYVSGGSNGITSVRIVTKTSDETINVQPNPDRWFYEVQKLTALMHAGDMQAFISRQDATLAIVETMERARTDAGLFFPGDAQWQEPCVK